MNKLFEAVPVSEKPDFKGYSTVVLINIDIPYLTPDQGWDTGDWEGATLSYTHWLRPLPPPTKEAEQRAKELYPDNTSLTTLNIQRKAERAAYLKGHSEASTRPSKELQRIPGEGDVQYNLRLEKYKSALECPCERCKEIVESYAQEASTGQAGIGYVDFIKFADKQHEQTGSKDHYRGMFAGYEYRNGEVKLLRDALEQIIDEADDGDITATVSKLDKSLDKIIAIAKNALSSTPSHTVEDDWVRVEDVLEWIYKNNWQVAFYKDEPMYYQLYKDGEANKIRYTKPNELFALYVTSPEGVSKSKSPTTTTDKVEEEIKRHSDTWEESFKATFCQRNGVGQFGDRKKTYLEQLENKLRNK